MTVVLLETDDAAGLLVVGVLAQASRVSSQRIVPQAQAPIRASSNKRVGLVARRVANRHRHCAPSDSKALSAPTAGAGGVVQVDFVRIADTQPGTNLRRGVVVAIAGDLVGQGRDRRRKLFGEIGPLSPAPCRRHRPPPPGSDATSREQEERRAQEAEVGGLQIFVTRHESREWHQTLTTSGKADRWRDTNTGQLPP
ncbi:MAG: hypothetical protein R3C10_19935 [Pirellulales bacterium]